MNPKKLLSVKQASRMRRLAGSLGLAMGLVIAALLVLTPLPVAEVSADGPDEAHVVVVFPGEEGAVRPISFTTSISRIGALHLAGWNVVADGDTVCSIEGVGCPASDCFCPDNWWSSAEWDGTTSTWDTLTWPPPAVSDGGIVGFRWSTAWGPPLLPGPAYAAASEALDWLRLQQSAADGGYGNTSGSVESLLSIGANNLDAGDWRRQADSPSLEGHMLVNGTAYANTGPAEAGKMAVGLAAAESCWPVSAMEPMDYYSSISGTYSSDSGPLAWAMLGTRAFSQAVPGAAVDYLKNNQQSDGGWEWAPGWSSDTNTTALAIQALVAAGEPVTSTAVISGLNFLEAAQNNDGGFPYDPDSPFGTDSDTNSTAYVTQAVLAGGEDPLTGTWMISNSNPISYLLNMRLSDGSFEWQVGQGANQLATQQAIPALLNRPFPLQIGAPDRCNAGYMPIIRK